MIEKEALKIAITCKANELICAVDSFDDESVYDDILCICDELLPIANKLHDISLNE